MKIQKKIVMSVCCLAIFLACAFVGQSYAAPAVPNTPRDVNKKISPVYVEFEGNDSIGSLLSTRLKEHFNTSNLFVLERNDVPKFRILVSSVSEFETRPTIGSAYSVIWLFSLSDATLRHYLAMDLGVISADGVNDLVARLVEKTDSLVTRYDYLFPKKD